MPDYVYALHDFLPEHEDEVSFRAGERIEVIERDDQYGDGWWQGRNLAGKIGLFPQSYTAPALPTAEVLTSSTSTSSAAASDITATAHSNPPLIHPNEENGTEPSAISDLTGAPSIYLNGHDTNGNNAIGAVSEAVAQGAPPIEADGEVMKATMTDVQKAIEQLGRARGESDADGARSINYSFASSRDERDTDAGETDTDFDPSDVDGDGEGWHKGARQKLAEKARRAVAEAEKLEMIMREPGGVGRVVVPPIEVEMSDESEGEDDHDEEVSPQYERQHPHISEESEDDDIDEFGRRPKAAPSEDTTYHSSNSDRTGDITLSALDEADLQTATAPSFPPFAPPPAVLATNGNGQSPDAPLSILAPSPAAASIVDRKPTPFRESFIPLPSPTTSFYGIGYSKHNSIASSTPSVPPLPTNHSQSQPQPQPQPQTQLQPQPEAQQPSATSQINSASTGPRQLTPVEDKTIKDSGPEKEKEKAHPNEWSVEDVVEWLKSKGFDQDVCDKFIEQEITGDVLLELDINLLKTEIGIVAFGKRMRIANAITDLRRPPSIVYSDHPSSPLSPLAVGSPFQSQNQSQPQSRHQSYGHTHSQSAQSSARHSLNSPLSYGGFANAIGAEGGQAIVDFPGSPMTKLGEVEGGSEGASEELVGLGIGLTVPGAPVNGKGTKSRLAQLSLSPSDGALNGTSKAVSDIPEEGDEEKGVVSESEASYPSSMRRRLFGRSHDSAGSQKEKDKRDSSNSHRSKEAQSPVSSATSPIGVDKDGVSSIGRHSRAKKSIDVAKPTDRHSLFGGAFSATLGRKPPPRYSSSISEGSEKSSSMSLSRLYGGGSKRSPSSTLSPPKYSPKEKEQDGDSLSPKLADKKERDAANPGVLRKRTTSSPGPSFTRPGTTPLQDGSANPLKAGQSILEQIGSPDHNGWMKKKSDRYNTWRLRYFILKGQHMYCLKSNSKIETKIKGYINIVGYKVIVDENVNPGRYGFKIVHEHDKTHFFSSEEKTVIRDWMKAIMKATIGRDYSKPVISSCNIPTIPLMVAQAMNPAPRPPSPTARAATQKAMRRENPHQLSSRDARVLMGLPSSNGESKDERARLDSFFTNESVDGDSVATDTPMIPKSPAPPRPSREMRRLSSAPSAVGPIDDGLVEWANGHLPSSLQITDPAGSLCSGLGLLRLAESIKGRPSSPPVPDSAFPTDLSDDKLDGLFRLFDFLLDNDVKMGSVSINDVRQGRRDKIIQLLRALKAWEDKRNALLQSISKGSVQAGGFMAPVGLQWNGL